jgi:hypothetical protein
MNEIESHPTSGSLPEGWASLHRLIGAAKPKLAADAVVLQGLLKQSRRQLDPLDDPFCVDLGAHRWLAGEHEEAYSDWLQWVIEQFDQPAAVFELFGLEKKTSVSLASANRHPKVEREVPVDRGHSDRTGRLDLLISYPDEARLVVEVKKGNADKADTKKQAGYKKWLDRQPEPCKESVLLATEGDKGTYEGFEFVAWHDVCVRLRRIAAEWVREKWCAVAALTLAFVGAVEQNLLSMKAAHLRRVLNGQSVFFNPQILDYFESALSEDGPMSAKAGTPSPADLGFLQEGARSYRAGLSALTTFRREVIERCRAVIEARLPELGKAWGGVNLSPDKVTDWGNKALTERTWDGSEVGLGVQIKNAFPDLIEMYFGLYWCQWDDASKGPWFGVYAGAWLNMKHTKWLVEELQKLYPDDRESIGSNKNEVWISRSLQPEAVGSFEPTLEEFVSRWVNLGEKCGGLEKLLVEG